jgi:hypothetical protein
VKQELIARSLAAFGQSFDARVTVEQGGEISFKPV